MGMREKLIELCEDLETLPCCDTHEGQADYLIANGVTIPVRCKDCKNALTNIPKPLVADPKKPVCTKWINWRTVEPDYFCPYGERRTDG